MNAAWYEFLPFAPFSTESPIFFGTIFQKVFINFCVTPILWTENVGAIMVENARIHFKTFLRVSGRAEVRNKQ